MPHIIMIGGPNGAGKTTSATRLLPEGVPCDEFINADAVAAGLSRFRPDRVAFEAGRIMQGRIHRLADAKVDFAFESTMAARSFAPFLRRYRHRGYDVHLAYLWLRSPELALKRVAARVKQGGHGVPEDVVRRRYYSGLMNFLEIYTPLADMWTLYDNSDEEPRRIAHREFDNSPQIEDAEAWQLIQEMIRQ